MGERHGDVEHHYVAFQMNIFFTFDCLRGRNAGRNKTGFSDGLRHAKRNVGCPVRSFADFVIDVLFHQVCDGVEAISRILLGDTL